MYLMKIRFLSKREINLLIEQLNEFSSFNIDSKIKQVKSIELSEDVQILHSKYFIFILRLISVKLFLSKQSKCFINCFSKLSYFFAF